MTERDALLRAILEQPDDDTSRLVFADYLQENGGQDGYDRACMIRNEVAIHAAGGESISWVGSESPTRRHYRPWMLRELDALPFDGKCEWEAAYTRGFVSEIHLPCAAFMEHAKAIFGQHPVTKVVLTDKRPDPTGGGRFYWAHQENFGNDDSPESCCLPDELFWPLVREIGTYLDDPDERLRWLYCESEAENSEVISRICVAYGRGLASLPPHTPKEVARG